MLRHPDNEQSYFWTQDWQQAERLASSEEDYDPTDVDDLIRWLESNDEGLEDER